MNRTISYTETLVVVTCTCGMNFAIPAALNTQALEHRGPTGQHVYCPLGHSWHYTGKTEADQLREEKARLLARLDQERARGATLERSRAAVQGELTKARKRAAAAVCPVPGCKRQVVQMKRHLATKHPGWQPEEHSHEVPA